MNEHELIDTLAVPRYAPRPFPTPIPTSNWDDEPLYCVKVNEQWLSHVIGALIVLNQPDTWEGNEAEIEAARQQVVQMIVAFMEDCNPMDNCCPEPNRIRININNNVEISYDGGNTWVNGGDYDPRQTAPQFPPLLGEASNQKRCDAAANVEFHFKAHADQLSANAEAWSTLQGLLAAIATLLIFLSAVTLGALTPLALAVGAALLKGGKVAFEAAMTDEVWVRFNCSVYCHMDDDGNLTESDIEAICTDIEANENGIAGEFLMKTVRFMGLVGMNNMARTTTGVEGNCVDCQCEQCCIVPENWGAEITTPYGTTQSGTFVSSDSSDCTVLVDLQLDDIRMEMSANFGASGCMMTALPEAVIGGGIGDETWYVKLVGGEWEFSLAPNGQCIEAFHLLVAQTEPIRMKFTMGQC